MKGHLTATEAARELGVSLQTVLRRIESGVLHAERVGRRLWLVPLAEIERLRHSSDERSPGPADGHMSDASGPEMAARQGRLTIETLAHLKETNERIWAGRQFIGSSTEILREAREERINALRARHGLDHDELGSDQSD